MTVGKWTVEKNGCVQNPGSVMVEGCVNAHGMGNMHMCKGTINAERYIRTLK